MYPEHPLCRRPLRALDQAAAKPLPERDEGTRLKTRMQAALDAEARVNAGIASLNQERARLKQVQDQLDARAKKLAKREQKVATAKAELNKKQETLGRLHADISQQYNVLVNAAPALEQRMADARHQAAVMREALLQAQQHMSAPAQPGSGAHRPPRKEFAAGGGQPASNQAGDPTLQRPFGGSFPTFDASGRRGRGGRGRGRGGGGAELASPDGDLDAAVSLLRSENADATAARQSPDAAQPAVHIGGHADGCP
ncbi:hypothetical protein WJX72_011035 [[Myrmecia] bisecta]|uniref:Uncharacterized protein n=1 Tax=[Myrmecia] bisecta TaxID=41462 RepID=A0AAW1QSU1_9CHLO